MCTISASNFCEINPQGVHYYNPTDCNKYFYCNTRFIQEQQCSANLIYELSSGQCKFLSDVPCAQEVVESTPVGDTIQITASQSEIDSSIIISRTDATSQNLPSTSMDTTFTQIVSMSDVISLSTSTDSDVQPTETISVVSSSAVQG